MQRVAIETWSELGGDPLEWKGPDPVKFQGGRGVCLIEKSLLHFLLRLLSCIHLHRSQLPRYLRISVLHSCMLASSYSLPGTVLLCCCCWWLGSGLDGSAGQCLGGLQNSPGVSLPVPGKACSRWLYPETSCCIQGRSRGKLLALSTSTLPLLPSYPSRRVHTKGEIALKISSN